MKHVTIQFRKYHVTSPWISRQRSFLVPCRYRDSEIMEPKNCLPRTSSALPIKLHLLKDFPCPYSQEIEQFIWLELQLYVKLIKTFFCITQPPCCIDPKLHLIVCAMQSGTDLRGLFSIQSHFDTNGSLSIHIWSQFDTNWNQFDTNWGRFVAKVN